MLKHLDDGAEFNMAIDDNGALLVICPKCGKIWKGDLTLVESPLSAKKVRQMVDTAWKMNPSVLKEVGFNEKMMTFLKSF